MSSLMNRLCFILLMIIFVSNTLTVTNPEIPYITQMGTGLNVGDKIAISGRITADARNFAINLREGWDGERGTIHLHFNMRFFAPHYVMCNTHIAGVGWTREERVPDPFPFKKGHQFLIEILCEQDQFNISVEGLPYYAFKYRLPLNGTDVLEINGPGQVDIFTINVKEDKTANTSQLHPCRDSSLATTVATDLPISKAITSNDGGSMTSTAVIFTLSFPLFLIEMWCWLGTFLCNLQ